MALKGNPNQLATLPILIILPERRSIMRGATACVTATTARTFVSKSKVEKLIKLIKTSLSVFVFSYLGSVSPDLEELQQQDHN